MLNVSGKCEEINTTIPSADSIFQSPDVITNTNAVQQQLPTTNINIVQQRIPTTNINIVQQRIPTTTINIVQQHIPNTNIKTVQQHMPATNINTVQQHMPSSTSVPIQGGGGISGPSVTRTVISRPHLLSALTNQGISPARTAKLVPLQQAQHQTFPQYQSPTTVRNVRYNVKTVHRVQPVQQRYQVPVRTQIKQQPQAILPANTSKTPLQVYYSPSQEQFVHCNKQGNNSLAKNNLMTQFELSPNQVISNEMLQNMLNKNQVNSPEGQTISFDTGEIQTHAGKNIKQIIVKKTLLQNVSNPAVVTPVLSTESDHGYAAFNIKEPMKCLKKQQQQVIEVTNENALFTHSQQNYRANKIILQPTALVNNQTSAVVSSGKTVNNVGNVQHSTTPNITYVVQTPIVATSSPQANMKASDNMCSSPMNSVASDQNDQTTSCDSVNSANQSCDAGTGNENLLNTTDANAKFQKNSVYMITTPNGTKNMRWNGFCLVEGI